MVPSRREFLRAGLTGFSTLGFAELLRRRAALAAPSPQAAPTAIILVWLRGGASHLETFDPKPEAPAEFRGPFSAIDTNVPGIRVSELLPRLSQIANRYSLLRSVAHTGGGHPAGSLQVLAGDPDPQDKITPVLPDWMSIASYLRRDPRRAIPSYVSVNPVDRYDSFTIAGATYLGPAYEPFTVTGDPSHPQFQVPNIGLPADQQARFRERLSLKQAVDHLRRDIDATGALGAMDQFESQALNLLTSPAARAAFDLASETDATRDRYGRHAWGTTVPTGSPVGRSRRRYRGHRVRWTALRPSRQLGRSRG